MAKEKILKPFAVICNIDGTLADASHREKTAFKRKGNSYSIDPELFYKNTITDPVNVHIRAILMGLQKLYGDALMTFICASRPGTLFSETEKWLKRNSIEYTSLLMRDEGDPGFDHVFKAKKILQVHNNYTLILVIDNEDSVGNICKKNNIPFVRS